MFWKKTPTITFHAQDDVMDMFPHPVPAKKAIPEWYRKLKPTVKNFPVASTGTSKRCVPMLDAFSHGYIIPLWADLYVQISHLITLYDEAGNQLGKPVFHAGNDDDLIGEEVSDLDGNPIVAKVVRDKHKTIRVFFPFEYYGREKDTTLETHAWNQVGEMCDLKRFEFGKELFKFVQPWQIKTPKGWSVHIKSPPNAYDNDIQLIEGVVDTDAYHATVHFPFVWTGSEEGEFVIKKGTPIAQVIPFKRQKTKHKVLPLDKEALDKTQMLMETTFYDRYKRFFWHKRKTE